MVWPFKHELLHPAGNAQVLESGIFQPHIEHIQAAAGSVVVGWTWWAAGRWGASSFIWVAEVEVPLLLSVSMLVELGCGGAVDPCDARRAGGFHDVPHGAGGEVGVVGEFSVPLRDRRGVAVPPYPAVALTLA